MLTEYAIRAIGRPDRSRRVPCCRLNVHVKGKTQQTHYHFTQDHKPLVIFSTRCNERSDQTSTSLQYDNVKVTHKCSNTLISITKHTVLLKYRITYVRSF